ncbi:MAG: 3-dehydroquinate synthase [Limnochordales bacterium]|nr:3-dehydroquinate synthase [Limnochordales bacterium]
MSEITRKPCGGTSALSGPTDSLLTRQDRVRVLGARPQRGPGIVLIGLMGAGKSTVGRLLAEETGLPFVDLDAWIEERAGLTVERIFAELGEESFRRMELEALQALAAGGGATASDRGLVVATGGGTPCREAAWPLLHQLGMVVWLKVDPALAAERLVQKEGEVAARPLLKAVLPGQQSAGEGAARFQAILVRRLAELLAERAGWYSRADLHLSTAQASPAELARTIAQSWRCRLAVRTISVSLASRSYEVKIGRGLLQSVGPLLRQLSAAGSALLVTNPTVARLYGDKVCRSLAEAGFTVYQLLMEDGEEHKNLATVNLLYERAAAVRAEREWPVVALGGGVVGDTAGFFAATYLRGLPFIQVPTTLLAQVDASVGGKVGVDLPSGKNLVGAFYQPRAVIVDPQTLASLPARQLRSGMAEVIKTAALDGGELLDLLKTATPSLLSGVAGKEEPEELWERILELSIAYKARIVETDEQETGGMRRVLNLGHTVGHALEALTGYRAYTHGEAVAIGMVVALRLSRLFAGLAAEEEERIVGLLEGCGLPLVPSAWRPESDWERLAALLLRDKKVRAGEINFVLLREPGKPQVQPLPLAAVRQVLDELWPVTADSAEEGRG